MKESISIFSILVRCLSVSLSLDERSITFIIIIIIIIISVCHRDAAGVSSELTSAFAATAA